MELLARERLLVEKIKQHMNQNHLGDDGTSEEEWTDADVMGVALRFGLEAIAKEHNITEENYGNI